MLTWSTSSHPKIQVPITQLTSTNGLETWREAKRWMTWLSCFNNTKKSPFLPLDLHVGCGETFPRGSATQRESIFLLTSTEQ